jgi:molecular chaperone DnaJ
MVLRDPYAILGVRPGDDDAAIRGAFRRKAATHHPDRQRGLAGDDLKAAQDRFADINWAYQQVETVQARQAHDAKLARHFQGQTQAGETGGSAMRALPERGEDVRVQASVSFAEAFTGCMRHLSFAARSLCEVCGGSGAAPGAGAHVCPDCRGAGRHELGDLSAPCSRCEGWGQIVTIPCPACERGITGAERTIDIEVPPGVRSGNILRIAREGEPGWRLPGDLLVEVHVDAHPFFVRGESDLQISVPVRYSEALLGADVRIPSPSGGALRLAVPPGTQSGTKLRVSGQGFPHYRNPELRGDLYALISVDVPDDPSPDLKRLAVQLRALEARDVRSHFFA